MMGRQDNKGIDEKLLLVLMTAVKLKKKKEEERMEKEGRKGWREGVSMYSYSFHV